VTINHYSNTSIPPTQDCVTAGQLPQKHSRWGRDPQGVTSPKFQTHLSKTPRTINQLTLEEVVSVTVSPGEKTTKNCRCGGYRALIVKFSILPASVEDSDVSPPIPASSELQKLFRDHGQTPQTHKICDLTLANQWESRLYKFQR
jgi:hypothetical protein